MSILTGFAIVICLFLAYVLGITLGYARGVEETEKRWSDTVSKAEWVRKYGDTK